MYFFKLKGRQILDLRGDLILSHNPQLVRGRIKSAAPASVRNGQWVEDIPAMSMWRKVKASWHALRFIWAPSRALTTEPTE